MGSNVYYDSSSDTVFADLRFVSPVTVDSFSRVVGVLQDHVKSLFPIGKGTEDRFVVQPVGDRIRVSIAAAQISGGHDLPEGVYRIVDAAAAAQSIQAFTFGDIQRLIARRFVRKHLLYAPYKGYLIGVWRMSKGARVGVHVREFRLYQAVFTALLGTNISVSGKPLALGRFKPGEFPVDSYMQFYTQLYLSDESLIDGVYRLSDEEEFPDLDTPELYQAIQERAITVYDVEQLLAVLSDKPRPTETHPY